MLLRDGERGLRVGDGGLERAPEAPEGEPVSLGSCGPITEADAARFEVIHRIGCVACRKHRGIIVPCEIHHLTGGGHHGQKRRGHQFTIGLCAWHHRGVGVERDLLPRFGPSYARQPKVFREVIGTDAELLKLQNHLIATLEAV